MAVCAKLDSLLNQEEINSVPENVRTKIDEHLTHLCELIDDLKNQNAKTGAVSERQQFQFEKELFESQNQLKETTETCAKFKSQISDLEENLNSVQKQWRDLQRTHDTASLELQSTKRNNELLNQEKKHLAEQLEKRRKEIEKLNDDLKNLLSQTTTANEEKYEAIATAEEAKMKESNLKHHVNRLEQEKNLLEQQINDLNGELSQKNHEIHTLKREKSSTVLELQSLLEHRVDELHLLQKQVNSLKENSEDKDRRIEALAEKIRSLNQTGRQTEEQFTLELNAQTKLVDLYKKGSEDNQKRIEELVRAFEEMQKLLHESADARNEIEKQCESMESQHKLQLEQMETEITRLKGELKRAGDLAQDKAFNPETLENMFPTAAATSKVMRSGMTLTQMYSEYVKAQEEVQRLKNENLRLNQQLKQIIKEIGENTPVINQRMQDYHKAVETISCLRTQLASSLTDYEVAQSERCDAKRISGHMERENSRLKSQVSDLNRQVQMLLKEVEESRGGFIRHGGSLSTEGEVSSSDEITANKVISRHLVTFRDIVEIQTKNQQLLAVVRDLSEQHEQQEKKTTEEKTAGLQKDLEKALSELEELQKSRVKQAEMVETIIRQRDMYRVLLSNQGFSESLLGSPHGTSPMRGGRKSLSPGGSRELETKSAMKQLQFEFDNYKKEKAENLKMSNEHLEKIRNEVADLRIQNAKLSSQCEYSEERVSLLQSNIENYKKESVSLREKNQKHTSMVTQHQQTINTLRQDMMIAHEKIAKSEVALDNLKAERDLLKGIESRLLQEKESMFREQQHQSRVLSNLQSVQNNLERIESESKRNLQYQVEKIEKENVMFRAKLENANEEYRSAVKIWEKQTKELQQKVDLEVEKNRKLHEDLVDAYSRFHALNQELAAAKTATSSDAQMEKKQVSSSPAKPPQLAHSAAEVKSLKEQLNEAQARMKSIQEKMELTQKSSNHYLGMCNDLELRVKEQDEINKQLKDSMDSAVHSSDEARKSLEQSLEEMEKSNRDLIEENMKLTQNKNSKLQELQKQVVTLQKQIDANKDESETAVRTAAQAREDCQTQRDLMIQTQEKYERELMLHAEAVQSLTIVKEEHQKCGMKIEHLNSTIREAENALANSRTSWAKQEQMLLSEQEAVKKRIVDLEKQNDNLHHQLELMGTQMAAVHSKNWDEVPMSSSDVDNKDTQHLLQIIQYIKKEKEIISTQYDATQSENVRLKLKVEQLTSELNDIRGELREIQNNTQVKASSDAQHAELLRKIEMMNLLTESNSLLRIEKEKLTETKDELDAKVQELEKQIQPLNEANKDMTSQLDTFSAENTALRQEVKSWQSRTNQLLEQSHRIGPQEYKNLTRELEELKTQKVRLAEELQRKQAEVSQLNANLVNIRKELESSRTEIREKSQEIVKMTEGSAEHQKTMVQVKKIGRKYKTQFDELKISYDALLTKTKVSESAAQEQSVLESQKKVQESEKTMKDLRDEVELQKKNVLVAKKETEVVQNQLTEKEERARKLLAHVRQKYSELTSQKEILTSDKSALSKENEEIKAQINLLKQTCDDDNVRVVTLKSQYDTKITRLERELKASKESIEYLEKQYDELCQKMAQQQKQSSKPTAVGGLVERGGSSSSEPLTANIKPLATPAPASGSGVSLRHTPHPHVASPSARSTPTASIRPMAIGTVAASAASQTRMAAVLPTTAATSSVSTGDEDVVIASPASAVPQATVQPTPATATVAPTTVSATVSPLSHTLVISEVTPTPVSSVVDSQIEPSSVHTEPVQSILITAGTCVSAPVTALVSPRIEGSDGSESTPVESPAPTTSVIVSPPATQTQVVTPTVKRPREESQGSAECQDGLNAQKRVRMISEGSQTNQQLAVASTPPSNIAVVSAATVVSRSKPTETPTIEVSSTTRAEIKDPSALIVSTTSHPSVSSAETTTEAKDESTKAVEEKETEVILELEDKDAQNIDWDGQENVKVAAEFEVEVMEEEGADQVDEFEEDVEQMQGITFSSRSVDEDMVDDSVEDVEEMGDQPASLEIIDVLDSGSDHQMEADSNSLQAPPGDQCMAPPSFPVVQELSSRTEVTPVPEGIIVQSTLGQGQRTTLLPRIPMRQDRLPSVGRQNLTPFTIQGQGPSFEDGDDSIVPSTPTLFVPRRTDGFAEAVSSPHVPQVRFLFSSQESSPTQQGLSQLLASQGGVDDTRMDLSQFDDGSGRTVPSTPLQVSPPAETSVPEVPEVEIEISTTSQRCELIVPTIKVDFVHELGLQAVQKPDSIDTSATPELVPTATSKPEIESKTTEDESKTLSEPQPVISSSTAEDNDGSSTSLDQPLPKIATQTAQEISTLPVASELDSSKLKDSETSDNESQNQGPPSAQAQQRKPIIWQEDSPVSSSSPTVPVTSPSASSTTTMPTQSQFPPPLSQSKDEPPSRTQRARRMRYRGAGGVGRATGAWVSPNRRSRGGSRRGRMF